MCWSCVRKVVVGRYASWLERSASIAVCAGVSFVKVVGKSFAVEVASTVLGWR